MARILVAEDDLLVGDTVQTMLRSGGYEVVLARNGDEAIRIFGEQKFDLVLCDVHMPGKDGLEVTEEIRRLSPDIPIVSMTGSYPRDTGGAHLDPAS
jgi:CheY-like chemotaxis protein